jgi:hypothetical protein
MAMMKEEEGEGIMMMEMNVRSLLFALKRLADC